MSVSRHRSSSLDSDEFERQLEALSLLLDRRAVLSRSAATVAGVAGLDLTWIGEVAEDGLLHIGHVHGTRTDVLVGLAVPSGWGLTGKAFAAVSPLAVEDYFAATTITHHFDPEIQAEGVCRLIAAPIVVDGRAVGVLSGGSRSSGSFGDIGVSRLQDAARRTSTALQAADRSRQLAEVTVHAHRHQIATQLHDNVGALLFAIQAGVRDLAGALSDDDPLRAQAESIEAHAAEAASALRESLSMMDVASPHVALEAELRSDAQAFEQRSGVATSLIVLQSDALHIDGARAEAIVGALREGLLNVEKHAKANSVVITVARRSDVMSLTLTDDGRGPAPEPVGRGFGLTEMRRRVGRLGGTVELTSPDEGGAVLRVRLPI